jgi:hypothetical protein
MSANEKIEATEEKKNNLTEKLTNETNQLKEHEERLVEIEKSYESTKLEYDRINEEVAKTTEEFQSFERRDVKMHEDTKHYNAQVKTILLLLLFTFINFKTFNKQKTYIIFNREKSFRQLLIKMPKKR